MDFCKQILGKSLRELSFEDIEQFFSEEREESEILEFKSFSATYGNFNKNLEGIIRGICALLNSEGGLLVWGAPEGVVPQGKSEKVFKLPLSPCNELKEKDWLINKISDSITPLPVSISVEVIKKSDSILYIFEVQQSQYRPHQYKNTYYARLDGQTKPAPHYLVEALFRQIKYPNLEGFIKLNKISHNGQNYFLSISVLMFNFSELQNEENVSYVLTCDVGVFQNYNNIHLQKNYSLNGHQFIHKGNIDILHYSAPDMHNEVLVFNPHELIQKNNECDLVLMFGGKYSPMKASSYKLNFQDIDWNKADHPNYLIKSMNENILMSDRQAQLGSNREKILKELLKR